MDDMKCMFPTVSPDGKWIAFTRGAAGGHDSQGLPRLGKLRHLRSPRTDPRRRRRDHGHDKNDMWPSWSADSKTVFFTSEGAGLGHGLEGSRSTAAARRRSCRNPHGRYPVPTAARDGKTLVFECDNQHLHGAHRRRPAREVPILCRTDERGPHDDVCNVQRQ